jgi:hypothetical protein
MRIGLITGEYPPDEGGVGDFTQEIGKGLAALIHDVHVITSKSPVSNLRSRCIVKSMTGGGVVGSRYSE